MKTKYLFLAALSAIALTSCTSEDFVGLTTDNSPTTETDGSINFGFEFPNATRANIAGGEAAKLLGNNFYVTGTKGTEQDYYPTPTLVFDNYLVHYEANTAGNTESNTANWEYVGIDQAVSAPANYNRVKLSSINGAQTIKYWDYSAAQYDFFGFSTGNQKAVAKTAFTGAIDVAVQEDEIGVTAMLYGSALNVQSTIPTAYTFYIPTLNGLENTYITDITEVAPGAYGKEVTLRFKNLGSKIRVAFYETVPGYSVKDVKFYTADAGATPTDLGATETDAYLIGANNLSFPTKGTVAVRFEHVGNQHAAKQDYDKASAQVVPVDVTYDQFKKFDALTAQLTGKERDEVKWDEGSSSFIAETGKVFLGRTLPTATFAGDKDKEFYQTVFPNTSGYPVTLRVDYTLVPIDGARETIVVKGAKAVVPSTYTRWLPNYAYTYIFKISDNTNGWTGTTSQDAGLFPITFDAVVAESIDATAEQTTITTVATPTITTYQQYHYYTGSTTTPNEYEKNVKDLEGNTVVRNIYVQVMNNFDSPATLYEDLNGTTPGDNTKRSLLYAITGTAPISEATVMDALENQASVETGVITGRNGMILTPHADDINAAVESIVNGVDNNPINITKGQAAEINMSAVTVGTYAYVYDYTSASDGKVVTEIYQPIVTVPSSTSVGGMKFVATTTLDLISATTSEGDAVDHDYIYFSKTNKTLVSASDPAEYTYTYSFVSVDGKETLPAGLIKVAKSSLGTTASDAKAEANTFYFAVYNRNDGKYAVKVIKVVNNIPVAP